MRKESSGAMCLATDMVWRETCINVSAVVKMRIKYFFSKLHSAQSCVFGGTWSNLFCNYGWSFGINRLHKLATSTLNKMAAHEVSLRQCSVREYLVIEQIRAT